MCEHFNPDIVCISIAVGHLNSYYIDFFLAYTYISILMETKNKMASVTKENIYSHKILTHLHNDLVSYTYILHTQVPLDLKGALPRQRLVI